MSILVVALLPLVALAAPPSAELPSVLLHPIYDQLYSCLEHVAGQLPELGDALGTDCTIVKLVEDDGRKWVRAHAGDGRKNEDWYGWRQSVLAPIDGKVAKVHKHPVTNLPGVLGQGRATMIVVAGKDGTNVLLAHVDDPKVKEGDAVTAGQVIAVVGNNGQARAPHVHVGAWKGKDPLQIRFDQRKMKMP